MRARSAPAATDWPSCGNTWSTEPPISARTVASRSAFSSPETRGPTVIGWLCTSTTFSRPISICCGALDAAASGAAPLPQAESASALATTIEPVMNEAVRVTVVLPERR